MKKRLITYVIIAQTIIILAIIYSILIKKTGNVLGIFNTKSIQDPHLSITPNGNLKYFFEPKANITFTNYFHSSTITINSDSLNETRDYKTEKPAGTYRIITIGDSFTFGSHVSSDLNWTALLEESLNKLSCKKIRNFEVINLGVAAYDAACSVERFKKRGIKYNPDLVIWYQVDLLRLNEEIRREMKNITGESFGYQSIVDGIDVWNTARDNVLKRLGEDEILEQNKKSIKELRSYFNGQVIITNIPLMDDVQKQLLKKVSAENNYLFADNFRNYYNLSGYFLDDHHPNLTGHKIIAEDLLNYMVEKKVISCN